MPQLGQGSPGRLMDNEQRAQNSQKDEPTPVVTALWITWRNRLVRERTMSDSGSASWRRSGCKTSSSTSIEGPPLSLSLSFSLVSSLPRYADFRSHSRLQTPDGQHPNETGWGISDFDLDKSPWSRPTCSKSISLLITKTFAKEPPKGAAPRLQAFLQTHRSLAFT